MRQIRAILVNTFRESVRDRILYAILFFALVMIGSSVLLAQITLGQFDKVIKDMGLSAISVFGILIAIFVGIGLVSKEIDRKTIYTIASKPVTRWQFLLGKYLGLLATLAVEVGVMFVAYLGLLMWIDSPIDLDLFLATWLIFVQLCVVVAVAVLFSTFSTPTLSAFFALALTLVGHLSGDIRDFGAVSESPAVQQLSQLVFYVLPDMQRFNGRMEAVHAPVLELPAVGFATAYGLLYAGILLVISFLIFRNRDFK